MHKDAGRRHKEKDHNLPLRGRHLEASFNKVTDAIHSLSLANQIITDLYA